MQMSRKLPSPAFCAKPTTNGILIGLFIGKYIFSIYKLDKIGVCIKFPSAGASPHSTTLPESRSSEKKAWKAPLERSVLTVQIRTCDLRRRREGVRPVLVIDGKFLT